jgi:hypothetical protein
MRVGDLRTILKDLERLFGISGARSQETAVARVADALPSDQDHDLHSYLKTVQQEIAEDAKSAAERYVLGLQQAGLDEKAFASIFSALEIDKKVKRAELLKIAEDYTGSVDRKAPAKKLLKHIKAHFYTKLYERDANELAKRATPV